MRHAKQRLGPDGALLFHPLCADRLTDALAQSLSAFADSRRDAADSIARVTAILQRPGPDLPADQVNELTSMLDAAQRALAASADDPASISRDDIAALAGAVRELLLTVHALTRPD